MFPQSHFAPSETNISDESIEIYNGELREEYSSIENFINKNSDKKN